MGSEHERRRRFRGPALVAGVLSLGLATQVTVWAGPAAKVAPETSRPGRAQRVSRRRRSRIRPEQRTRALRPETRPSRLGPGGRAGDRAGSRQRLRAALRGRDLRGRERPLLRRPERRPEAGVRDVRDVRLAIRRSWHELTRNSAIAALAGDPKFSGRTTPGDNPAVLYISAHEDLGRVQRRLVSWVGAERARAIDIRRLEPGATPEHPGAVLYVPHEYVVPGGRFDEMYGWDSFFIQKGLLKTGGLRTAKAMVNNHIYEVDHYGKVLNSTRAWSLTRSQPPLLTRGILDVYERTGDKKWLAHALDSAARYHAFWTSGTRLTRKTGLSRFYDDGRGEAAEVSDAGSGEYARTRSYFRTLAATQDVSRYYDVATDQLTEHYFTGERAGRESGFDTSSRFGPFGADTHEYNPVNLNSFLYVMERDMARMAGTLGRHGEAARWSRAAARRRRTISRLMWDEKRGLFVDHHVPTGRLSKAVFATTFVPLWAKLATREQAARVVDNLALLEAPGGLLTSDRVTGHQWDAPITWAPLMYFAVGGMRNYGYHDDANRVAFKFLSMVMDEYGATGQLFEKYDGVRRSADTASHVQYGYTSNEAGFGWTNGVFEELYAGLPRSLQRALDDPASRKKTLATLDAARAAKTGPAPRAAAR